MRLLHQARDVQKRIDHGRVEMSPQAAGNQRDVVVGHWRLVETARRASVVDVNDRNQAADDRNLGTE